MALEDSRINPPSPLLLSLHATRRRLRASPRRRRCLPRPLRPTAHSSARSLCISSTVGINSPPHRSRSLSPMAPLPPSPQQWKPRSAAPVQAASGGSGSGNPSSLSFPPPARDFTQDLPDEILALVFASLSPADRSACSLACTRWKEVHAATGHRLSLDAQAGLGLPSPALFGRLMAVTKLALRSARGSGADSLADEGAAAVAAALPSSASRSSSRRAPLPISPCHQDDPVLCT